MTRPILLQLVPLPDHPALQRVDQYYERVLNDETQPLPDALAQRVQLVLATATTPITAAFMDTLPALRGICNIGVGFDAIDRGHAHQRGVAVSNTPDVLNDCVADLAWALMLDTARRVSAADRYVRAGQWTHEHGFPLSTRVSGKKLGIVGLGRIGQAIAKRASGFDMQLRYHNRRPRKDISWHYEPSLIELAHWADILVVAAVGGDETRGLINRAVLDALGTRGILINIARGSVVDERALVQALQEGRLGGAGLDVFECEPQVPAALRQLDQVVLTPHVASATHETRAAMLGLALDNILHFQETGKLLTPVPYPT